MQKPVTVAVVRAGILPPEALQEISRWGLPLELVQVEEDDILRSAEDVVTHIREAIESDDLVRVRDTDLDVLHRYLAHQEHGRLFVHSDSGGGDFPISYCMTALGEYVIPWRSESIFDFMTDGDTHLRVMGDGKSKKVYFSDVRELFFGDHKAFMVCTPREG